MRAVLCSRASWQSWIQSCLECKISAGVQRCRQANAAVFSLGFYKHKTGLSTTFTGRRHPQIRRTTCWFVYDDTMLSETAENCANRLGDFSDADGPKTKACGDPGFCAPCIISMFSHCGRWSKLRDIVYSTAKRHLPRDPERRTALTVIKSETWFDVEDVSVITRIRTTQCRGRATGAIMRLHLSSPIGSLEWTRHVTSAHAPPYTISALYVAPLPVIVDVISVCIAFTKKISTYSFFIFVNVYCFNKRHVNCRKKAVTDWLRRIEIY